MLRLNRKNTKRMITATCLLILFGFTSLYVTYQNGAYLNAAHATSGSNSSGSNASDCIGPLLACAIAEMQALRDCKEHGDDSQECIEAKAHAICVCAAIPPGC